MSWLNKQILVFVFSVIGFQSAFAISEPIENSFYSPAVLSCKNIFPRSTRLDLDLVLGNQEFRNNRTLTEYFRFFELGLFSLKNWLFSLPKDSIWFEIGPGRRTALIRGLQLNPKVNAVAVDKTLADHLESNLEVDDRIRPLTGLYLDELDRKGMLEQWKGKVSLITDIFAAVSYAEDLQSTIKTYLELLRVNGTAYFIILLERREIIERTGRMNNRVYSGTINQRGRARTDGILKWLRSIEGVEIREKLHSSIDSNGNYSQVLAVAMTKTQAFTRFHSHLVPYYFVGLVPPQRLFRLIPDENLALESEPE